MTDRIVRTTDSLNGTAPEQILQISANTQRKQGNTDIRERNPCDRSVRSVNIRRGDIFYADLRPVVGSEQGGIRPVLIIQNDVGNRHSPTVICAAITSKMNKAKLPTHVEIQAGRYEIVRDSVILLEQLRTIDKRRLKDRVCHLDDEMLTRVDRALQVSLELSASYRQESGLHSGC